MSQIFVILLFTSLNLTGYIKYKFLHILLQVAQTRAEKNKFGESLEDNEIKGTKVEKQNKKQIVCVQHFWNFFHVRKISI